VSEDVTAGRPAGLAPLGLARYRHVVVLTGAGVSVASGLPTYRGAGGLWSTAEFARLADREALEADPYEVVRFFTNLRPRLLEARPNAAHVALARAEAARRASLPGSTFTVITQNVDRLHQRAGSVDVVELHGCLLRSRCMECDAPAFDDARAPGQGSLPRCPRCGALLRPDITLFGEMLPPAAERASAQALGRCDLFLAVGTSGNVWPAAGFASRAAHVGARCVYVNPEPLAARGGYDDVVLAPAEVALPVLLA
jgi:NAD-dependent deacetylase